MRGDSTPFDPAGLTPVEILLAQGLVLWADLGALDLTEPLFGESLRRLATAQGPPRLLPAALSSLTAPLAARTPTAVVFHMSRCGSTLLSQLLAAAPGTRVIAEAQPFNAILVEAARDHSESRRIDWLRGLVHAFARPAQNYIKFASWQVLALPLIKRAFPGLRWIFLYRDPVEVLVSHARGPGWLPADQPRAPLIADYFRTVLAEADENALLVNYDQLDEAHLPRILGFLGLPADGQEALLETRRYYSKDATRRRLWRDDRGEKQQAATPAMRDAVAQWLAAPYAELESRRLCL